jgi:hypothetical protein
VNKPGTVGFKSYRFERSDCIEKSANKKLVMSRTDQGFVLVLVLIAEGEEGLTSKMAVVNVVEHSKTKNELFATDSGLSLKPTFTLHLINYRGLTCCGCVLDPSTIPQKGAVLAKNTKDAPSWSRGGDRRERKMDCRHGEKAF